MENPRKLTEWSQTRASPPTRMRSLHSSDSTHPIGRALHLRSPPHSTLHTFTRLHTPHPRSPRPSLTHPHTHRLSPTPLPLPPPSFLSPSISLPSLSSPTSFLPHPGCLDKSYGIGKCGAWDRVGYVPRADVLAECAVSTPATWCTSNWCYVDPNNCKRSNDITSTKLLNVTLTGQQMFYSYTACNNIGTYNANSHKKTLVDLNRKSGLRIAFPNEGGTGYTMQQTDGFKAPFEINVGMNRTIKDFGRRGEVPNFFQAAMDSIGIKNFEVRVWGWRWLGLIAYARGGGG